MMEETETLGQGEFGEVRVADYRGTQVSGCGQCGCGLDYLRCRWLSSTYTRVSKVQLPCPASSKRPPSLRTLVSELHVQLIQSCHSYNYSHLRHKNLVQLVGVVFQGSTIQSIVMEIMGKGSLQKYLISRGRSVVTQAELLSFAKCVTVGL